MASELELLDSLSKWQLKLGIFTSEGMQTVPVSITADDGTVIAKQVKIADIMYFTEYGTITIPGRRVLEKCLARASTLMGYALSSLAEKILEGKITTQEEIGSAFNELAAKCQAESRAIVASLAKEVNVLGPLLGESDDENKYVFNPSKLSKYIRCSVEKR